MSKYKVGDVFISPSEDRLVINVKPTSNATLHRYDVQLHTPGTTAVYLVKGLNEHELDYWMGIGFKYVPSNKVRRIFNVGDELEHTNRGYIKYRIVSTRCSSSGVVEFEVSSVGTLNSNAFVEQAVLDDLMDRLGYQLLSKPAGLTSGMAIQATQSYPHSFTIPNGVIMNTNAIFKRAGTPLHVDYAEHETCVCEIRDLMMRGCKCGHLKKLRA